MVKKFSAFLRNRSFITVFTRAKKWCLPDHVESNTDGGILRCCVV